MVTTTALITGLASFEIYKLIQGGKKLEDFKNTFINIGINFMGPTEPISNEKIWESYKGLEFDLGKVFTLQKFLDTIKEKNNGVEIEMITYGSKLLYNKYGTTDEQEKRKKMNLFDLVLYVEEKVDKRLLSFECVDEKSGDVDVRIPSHI